MNIDELPGFRRRLKVESGEGAVIAMVEDDYHCMVVTLRHDGECVLSVEPDMHRAPWTTCPGAPAKLVGTFTGALLSEVTARHDKQTNCTHLHDLAVLAAAHAQDRGTLVYDILVSDPVDGRRISEIRRDGVLVLRFAEQDNILVEPEGAAGRSLFELRDWINALDGPQKEAARLLQWGAILGHGRARGPEHKWVASELPPSCYTFQPERVAGAEYIGKTLDFSQGSETPLAKFGATAIERIRSAGPSDT
jgi:hypothetical protein